MEKQCKNTHHKFIIFKISINLTGGSKYKHVNNVHIIVIFIKYNKNFEGIYLLRYSLTSSKMTVK